MSEIVQASVVGIEIALDESILRVWKEIRGKSSRVSIRDASDTDKEVI